VGMRVLHNGAVQRKLPALIFGYLRAARFGLRMVRDESANAEAIFAGGNGVVVCFWHNRLLPLTLCWRGIGIDMLISRSRDGRMMADTAKRFGHQAIEGSTARGHRDRRSAPAAREVVARVKAGRIVGITPDGPRGPPMRASVGAIRLARMAGVGILPVAASVSPSWRANSWDRMIVPYPLPGSRGALLIGDLVTVSAGTRENDLGRIRARLEWELNRISAEADASVGIAAVQPPDPAMV